MANINNFKHLFSATIYKRGEEYYNRGRVNFQSYERGIAHFEVAGSEYYDVQIQIRKDGTLEGYHCDCLCDFPCKHVCACLIYLQKDPFVDRDTRSIIDFLMPPTISEEELRELDRRRKRQKFESENASELHRTSMLLDRYERVEAASLPANMLSGVKIEPIFNITYNNTLEVEFRIGTMKMYVLKDIYELIQCIRDQRMIHYGKELEFIPTMDSFENPELIKWLIRNTQQSAPKNDYYYYSAPNSRYIMLSSFMFDELIEICHLDSILMKDERGIMRDHPILVENPKINVEVEKEEYGYRLHMVDNYSVVAMDQGALVFNRFYDEIYRSDKDWSRKCLPIVQAMSDGDLFIETDDLGKFASRIVKMSDGYIDFHHEFDAYLPDKPYIEFFLDMSEDMGVSCKLIMTYGLHELSFKTLHNTYDDIKRDKDLEERLLWIIETLFPIEDRENNVALSGTIDETGENIKSFLKHVKESLEPYGIVYLSDVLKGYLNPKPFKVNVGVKVQSDLLELQFISDIPVSEMAAILNSYQRKKKYYRMSNGDVIDLETENMEEFASFVDTNRIDKKALANGEAKLDLTRALTISNQMDDSKMLEARDSSLKELVNGIKNFDVDDIIIPETMSDILRDYQKSGYRWLKTMANYGFGGILADDMGIGKTIQVITLFEDLRLRKQEVTSLVVCPSSLILNWDAEIKKFAPELKVGLVEGFGAKREDIITNYKDYHVLVTSYDYMRRDHELYEGKTFEYLILDEAQFIKNQETQNAKSVKTIKANHRFALTGTPIENSLAELWSIFDFLMPNYLYNYNYFKNTYETNIVREKDEATLSRLKGLVEPFMLRRTKQEVLKELPEKIDSVFFVEMNENDRKIYDANLALMDKDLRKELEQNGVAKTRFAVLAMLTKLRQICCSPKLIDENYQGDSSKLSACVEYLEDCKSNGKKVLLFSQFTSLLDLLKPMLDKNGISYYVLTGATDKKERQRLVNAFNTDETDVFLISLKAGGTGLNLTAAEVVVHLDPWWNISAQNQATDRAYRLGQHNNVQVIRMIAKNSIEEKIMKLQESKKELADAIVEENEGIITKMDQDDILDLFK